MHSHPCTHVFTSMHTYAFHTLMRFVDVMLISEVIHSGTGCRPWEMRDYLVNNNKMVMLWKRHQAKYTKRNRVLNSAKPRNSDCNWKSKMIRRISQWTPVFQTHTYTPLSTSVALHALRLLSRMHLFCSPL